MDPNSWYVMAILVALTFTVAGVIGKGIEKAVWFFIEHHKELANGDLSALQRRSPRRRT